MFPCIIIHAHTTIGMLIEILGSTSGLPIVVAAKTPPKFLGGIQNFGYPHFLAQYLGGSSETPITKEGL